MALLEISVVPVGTNTASFSSHVNNAVKIIEEEGLNYQLTPTSTVIEGNIEQLMDVAKRIHENSISGTERTITNITIDDRLDKNINIDRQVSVVEKALH